jgi:hypothetical protein
LVWRIVLVVCATVFVLLIATSIWSTVARGGAVRYAVDFAITPGDLRLEQTPDPARDTEFACRRRTTQPCKRADFPKINECFAMFTTVEYRTMSATSTR